METVVVCSNCRRQMRLPASLVNNWVKCPGCGFTFVSESADTDPTVEAELERRSPRRLDLLPPPAMSSRTPGLMSLETEAPHRRARSSEATVPLHLVLLLLVLVSAAAFGAYFVFTSVNLNESGEWREFESKEGLFRVEMPGRPRKHQESAGTPVGKLTVLFQIVGDDPAYMVAYCDYPALVLNANTEHLFDLAIKGGIAGMAAKGAEGARVIQQKSIHWKGFPGRHAEFDIPGKGKAVVRCYLVRQRIYILMVGGAEVDDAAPDMRKFFDSFALTGVAAPPPADKFKAGRGPFAPAPVITPSKPGFKKAEGVLRR